LRNLVQLDACQVLRDGLRLIEQREREDASRLEALRTATKIGIEDIEAGRFKTFESADSLRAHIKTIKTKAIAET